MSEPRREWGCLFGRWFNALVDDRAPGWTIPIVVAVVISAAINSLVGSALVLLGFVPFPWSPKRPPR